MLALLYALYASLAVLLLAPLMPPLQNADETAHLARADQISHGGPIGVRIADGQFGGRADSGVFDLARATATLPGQPDHKVTRAMEAPVPWGELRATGFPNTAVNPPFFYLPASLAALAARHAGIALPHALVLMRLASGGVTVVGGAIAIAVAGSAGLWLFTILLLPMSLSLSAAVSQDGPMLACAALAAALFLRLRETDAASARAGWMFCALCVALTLLGTGRAPYTAFALLTLACPTRRRWRVAGFLCVVAASAAWSLRSAAYLPPPFRADGVVAPAAQLVGVMVHPWRIPPLAWHTFQAQGPSIYYGFIGRPGWLDVRLPTWIYPTASIALLAAAAACWRTTRDGREHAAKLSLLTVIAACGGVFLIQYMTWTTLGSPVIEGVQGRYFLAPALLASLCFASAERRVPRWLALPVVCFPVVGIAVTVHAVILRYYI